MKTTTLLWIYAAVLASAQVTVTAPPAALRASAPQAPPQNLTLEGSRFGAVAQMNAPQLLAAISDANAAHEDLLQAQAARRPALSGRSNILRHAGERQERPNGRYVTNDGVHVYRDWAVVHPGFHGLALKTGYRRTRRGQAILRRGGSRGLAATVTKAYYALLTGRRKYACRPAGSRSGQAVPRHQPAFRERRRSGAQRCGEVRTCALLQEQAFRDELAMELPRLDLAVLLFLVPVKFRSGGRSGSTAHFTPLPVDRWPAQNPRLQAANDCAPPAGRSDRRRRVTCNAHRRLRPGYRGQRLRRRQDCRRTGPLPNLGYFLTVSLNVPIRTGARGAAGAAGRALAQAKSASR